jgi:lipopolysaccharide heptosyltransferase II
MRAVVIVPGGLSEALQATPLLRTLKARLPNAHVTLAGPASITELAGGLPSVEEVLPLEALSVGANPIRLAPAWRELRRRRFDTALLCTSLHVIRLLVYSAGIPQRVGTGGGLTTPLLSHHVAVHPEDNNSATWLRLAEPLGIHEPLHTPEFVPEAAAGTTVARLLGGGFEDGRILIAIAPGGGEAGVGGASGTIWDHERFAHLANQLAARHGAGIVLIGSPQDREMVEAVLLDLEASALNLCGELGVDETAAVLSHCDLLIAGDSPLLHLAAAMGTPTVGLFGPTDGRQRGPYGSEHRVIQALGNGVMPISLEQIRVDDVLAGIEATA